MKISQVKSSVLIEASGIALLKLKSRFSLRLGNSLQGRKDAIAFPISCLPLVADLINEDDIADERILEIMTRFEKHGKAREKVLEGLREATIPDLPGNWNEILDPAQASAVVALTQPDLLGLCLFDEQGSGKTVMSIAAFDTLVQTAEIDAMIVVCPKSMVREWPKDINKFLGSRYNVVTAEGSHGAKYDTSLKSFDVLITNYEGIEAMRVPLIAKAESCRFLLVVDESYYLKNSESIRSEYIRELREHCKRCFVLCGTPAPNSAYDLVNQFDLADLGYTFGGFTKSKDSSSDWNAIVSLVEKRGTFIRRLKTEILQGVPEKQFHVRRVELKGKQAAMYESARDELVLELRKFTDETFKRNLATYFQRRSTLLQICVCPSAIDPTVSEVPAKYLVLDDLLNELISQGRKVILWSFYRNSLNELEARYVHFGCVRVDGSVSVSARQEAVRMFQEDPGTMLFIGNPAAAGAGITLHAAYDAVYVSYSNQAAHYLQSLDRIHRRGQLADQVNYYLLICKDTIEETEVIRLRGKEVRQHNLLGDHAPWPTSLDDALRELGVDD